MERHEADQLERGEVIEATEAGPGRESAAPHRLRNSTDSGVSAATDKKSAGTSTASSHSAQHQHQPPTTVCPLASADPALRPREDAVEPKTQERTTTDDDGRKEFDAIPDGGLEAWLQVLGSFVILVDTWGLVNSWGVFQTYYETRLLTSSSPSNISWIGSLQGALLMLVGVVSGPLFDAGYFRALVAVGLSLIVFGMFMTSLCTEYWQVLLAQGVTVGIGMGLTFLPSAAILAQYFRRRRALALGISSAGSPIAGIVIPVIFSRLEPRLGFGWATRVIAFVLLAISVVPVVCMHTRKVPSKNERTLVNKSDEEGGNAGEKKAREGQSKTNNDSTSNKLIAIIRHRLFDATALHDAPFVLFVAGSFFAFLVLYVPFFYAQLFAETKNIAGPDVSPYFVIMLNAGSILGRVLPNYVADAFAGSLNVMASCCAVSAVLAISWLGVRDFAGLAVFAVLYGGFSGGIVSICPSVIISLTPDLSRVGARMGMSFLLTGTAVLIGTPIAGAVVKGYGDAQWKEMQGYGAAGLVVATLLYGVARVVLYRAKRQWKA